MRFRRDVRLLRRVGALLLLLLAAACARAEPHHRRSHAAKAWPALHALPHQQVNWACPRFAVVPFPEGAGAGHIFSNIVLGIELATQANATFVLDDLDDPSMLRAKYGRYPGLLEFLNIKNTELKLRDVRRELQFEEVAMDWDAALRFQQCNIVIRVSDESCKSSTGRTHTASGFVEGCYTIMLGLYNKYRPLFMAKYAAVAAGHRHSIAPLFDEGTLNIAWHIRIGDISLHSGSPLFFENIMRSLVDACRALGVPVRHLIFSSAPGGVPPPGYEFMGGMGDVAWVNNATLVDTLHHFTMADAVVETGSSMPTIAHAISDGPLFIFSCPKEGCDTRFYDVDGLVRTDERGVLQTTPPELTAGLMLRAVRRGLVRLSD